MIVTYERENDPTGKSGTIPVPIYSNEPLAFEELQQKAINALAADESLRVKYNVGSSYFVDLDKFYLIRVYQGE